MTAVIRKRSGLLLGAGLVLLTAAVYGRTIGFDFVGLDDQVYVSQNPRVLGGVTSDSVGWALTTFHGSNWHPLTWLSLMIDAQIGGASPGVYHATNLALHLLGTLLLFAALRRMTGAAGRSAFVAALFAVHPLHVESVAWVAERKDVLSTVFWHASLLVYARYAERPSARRYAALAAVFALGLASKPMLVSLPFVLLLLDVWPLRRLRAGGEPRPGAGSGAGAASKSAVEAAATTDAANAATPTPATAAGRPAWRGAGRWREARGLRSPLALLTEKAPLFALSAASCAITLVAQGRGGAIASLERFPFWARLANAGFSYLAYLRDTFYPSGLAILYLHPGSRFPLWRAIAAWAILLVLTGLAVALARRRPYVFVGWMWYLATLLPVIGLVQVGLQGRADRYTYVPLTGIFLIVAWGAHDVARAWTASRARASTRAPDGRGPAAPDGRGPVAPVGRASAASMGRVRADGARADAAPRAFGAVAAAVVVVLAGLAYVQAGHWRDRMTLLLHVDRTLPGNYLVSNALGTAFEAQGDFEAALEKYREAVRIVPDRAPSRNNLGVALLRRGRIDEAIAELGEAVRLEPQSAESRSNLAAALARGGQPDAAADQYREAIRLAPGLLVPRLELADLLARRGDGARASSLYGEALVLDPESAPAYSGLCALLRGEGRIDEATGHCQKAIALDPGESRALTVLGGILLSRGAVDEALARLTAAVRSDPSRAEARANLAGALLRKGRLEEAVAESRAALGLAPDLPEAHVNLGIALSRRGDLDEAAVQLEAALRARPEDPMVHASLGLVRMRQGRLEDAARELGETVRLAPDFNDARLNLGVVLSELGRESLAAGHFREVLRRDPADERARKNLAILRSARRTGP